MSQFIFFASLLLLMRQFAIGAETDLHPKNISWALKFQAQDFLLDELLVRPSLYGYPFPFLRDGRLVTDTTKKVWNPAGYSTRLNFEIEKAKKKLREKFAVKNIKIVSATTKEKIEYQYRAYSVETTAIDITYKVFFSPQITLIITVRLIRIPGSEYFKTDFVENETSPQFSSHVCDALKD